jgi:hypothetical protein
LAAVVHADYRSRPNSLSDPGGITRELGKRARRTRKAPCTSVRTARIFAVPREPITLTVSPGFSFMLPLDADLQMRSPTLYFLNIALRPLVADKN